jgi:hypothetical protein
VIRRRALCSTITVTDAWVSCAAISDGACSTTSTSIVSGCDVTPTTNSCIPSATGVSGLSQDDSCGVGAKSYVIYPMDPLNSANNAAIATQLASYVKDPLEIYTSKSLADGGLNFWRLPLTDVQAEELSHLNTVRIFPHIDLTQLSIQLETAIIETKRVQALHSSVLILILSRLARYS